MYEKDKINKKSGSRPPNLFKKIFVQLEKFQQTELNFERKTKVISYKLITLSCCSTSYLFYGLMAPSN
jgi:hypothetical protein